MFLDAGIKVHRGKYPYYWIAKERLQNTRIAKSRAPKRLEKASQVGYETKKSRKR